MKTKTIHQCQCEKCRETADSLEKQFHHQINVVMSRLDEQQKRRIACAAPPRYDEVFFSGIEWLNSSSEEPLDFGEHTAVISDEMWKSKARYDPDLS